MEQYIYIDETGTLDFEDIPGERYFGIGSAHWSGEHRDALWDGHLLRLELEASGIKLPQGLHAKNDSPATRFKVFELISQQSPRLDVTMLLKSQAGLHVQAAGKVRLYKLAIWLHLKFVIPAVSSPGDRVFIVVGRLQTSGRRDAIRHAIEDVADQLGGDRDVIPCIWEAPSSWGIQVADYTLWRIQREDAFRKLGPGAELIDPHIRSRYYPWNRSEEHHK